MHIEIKKPCHENWDGMGGKEKRKFCSSCQKNVHNLSELTQRAAEEVVSKEENPCVRYYPNSKGGVQFRSSLPLLAVLASGCSYVPPSSPADPMITQASTLFQRGTAWVFFDIFGSVNGPSPADGILEKGLRVAAQKLTQLSEGVLFKSSSPIGTVMGEMVGEPVPVPTWEDTGIENLELTTPEEEVASSEE